MERVDLREYVVVSVWHGCNSDCSICMLSGVRDRMPAVPMERYVEILEEIRRGGAYRNLILSGAEVTTMEGLEDYVARAAVTGWFDKIQIQTNGRRLRDERYLRRLVDAGACEFFVSIQGLEKTHDGITRRRGSFAETMRGLDNLEKLTVNVIPNTVLTRDNLPDVPALMEMLAARRVSEVHLWNFYPMDETDTGERIVSLDEVIDLLGELLPIFTDANKPLVLKSFPECLSFGEPVFFDNGYPATVLPDLFWNTFYKCGFGTCVHTGRCSASECWGLSKAYIARHGDERHLLTPLRARARLEGGGP